MKKIVLFLLLYMAVRDGCMAQYAPLLGSNDIVWTNQVYINSDYSYEKFAVAGEAVFLGKTYKLINEYASFGSLLSTIYLREDVPNKKVYIYILSLNQEFLFYDFNPPLGNLTVYNIAGSPVTMNVTAVSGGSPNVISFAGGSCIQWREGWGSMGGLTYQNETYCATNFPHILLCHTRNGIQDFQATVYHATFTFNCTTPVSCSPGYSFYNTLTEPLKYETSTTISAYSTVAPSIAGRLAFDATQSISLLPDVPGFATGFQTQINSTGYFEAYIDGCGGSKRVAEQQIANTNQPKNFGSQSFLIYPNPSNTIINFDLNLQQDVDVTIEIMDNLGRVIKTISRSKVAAGTILTEDISSIENGIYLARLKKNKEVSVQKFVVQH